jgi:type IV secretory pathway component VirB8
MREVQIQQVKLDLEAEPQQARVYFATQLVRGAQITTNQWLATITFRFPLLTVNQLTNQVMQWDEEQKDYTLFNNMAFQVVEYGVQEVGSAQ